MSSPAIVTPSGDRPSSSGNQSRDVIWTGKVDISEEPFTVIAASGDVEDRQDVLLIWKLSAFLGMIMYLWFCLCFAQYFLVRPRIRLSAPAIIFKLSATLQPQQTSTEKTSEQYLPDGLPLPSNILQSLQQDTSIHGVNPQLSTLRFSRRSERTELPQQETLPIKVISRKPFRAIPALSGRVRFHRSPFKIGNPSLIAALEIDIPVFAQHPVEVGEIRLNLINGVVNSLQDEGTQKLPITCHPRDSLVRLYSISPNIATLGTPPASPVHTLEVSINIQIRVSDVCQPQIEIRFKANADFSSAVGPSQSKSTQSDLPSNKSSNPTPRTDRATSQRQAGSALQGAPGVSEENRLGFVIQFSAKEAVYVGRPFKWEIFVINRSSRQRKLGLTMLAKPKKGGDKRLSSRPPSTNAIAANGAGSVAGCYVDDNLLYTMIKSQASETTPLVCLNSDLRIG